MKSPRNAIRYQRLRQENIFCCYFPDALVCCPSDSSPPPLSIPAQSVLSHVDSHHTCLLTFFCFETFISFFWNFNFWKRLCLSIIMTKICPPRTSLFFFFYLFKTESFLIPYILILVSLPLILPFLPQKTWCRPM